MSVILEYIDKFENLDGKRNEFIQNFLLENLPEFTSDDKILEEIYYFRAYTFAKHIKKNRNGKYIITEWLESAYWDKLTDGAISCAVGHHLRELKWFKNADQIAKDYIQFWCENQKQLLYYNNWFIYAVWDYCLFTNNLDFAFSVVEQLEKYFKKFEKMHRSKLGIYKCVDNFDGMELSISSYGLRPTINSYVYANAFGLYKIFEYGGDTVRANKYKTFAENLKIKINDTLFEKDFYYNKQIGLYEEMPRLRPRFSNPNPSYDAKELIGYVPFYFGIGEKEHLVAWKYFSDKTVFSAPFGLTSADMSHSQFNFEFFHPCLWNGPVWPYLSSMAMTALYKTLENYNEKDIPIGRKDFIDALKTYAKSQYIKIGDKLRPWIDENLDGMSGKWLARDWRIKNGSSNVHAGKDYNHSTFIDLVLGGLCGLGKFQEKVTYNIS